MILLSAVNGMRPIMDQIGRLVFQSSVQGDIGDLSMDGRTLKVLMALDGRMDMATLARSLRMDLKTVAGIMQRLLKQHLVERVEAAACNLDEDFLDHLTGQLFLSVGPMAEVLVEDELAELGTDPTRVPCSRAAELVEILAQQIPREEKRLAFQKAMLTKMKEKAY